MRRWAAVCYWQHLLVSLLTVRNMNGIFRKRIEKCVK